MGNCFVLTNIRYLTNKRTVNYSFISVDVDNIRYVTLLLLVYRVEITEQDFSFD